MCRSGLTGVGGTATTRDGGGGARLWRRCSGVLEIGEGWGCGLGATRGLCGSGGTLVEGGERRERRVDGEPNGGGEELRRRALVEQSSGELMSG
jgi:hypothetical protein